MPVAPVVHIYRMLARQLIVLAHNLTLVIVIWFLFPWPLTLAPLLILPGLAINIIAVFGAVLALSIVAARFRDIHLIVATLLQLLFLITPIIWDTKGLRGSNLRFVADLNPIYHLIEVVRRPILGEVPSLSSWLFSGITAIVCMVVGCMFYARYRYRVPFWV
jgi:lipopolysaccharide transport system permease protein